jgi:nitrite reductase/ring-hydroxylating ferredoxin subunit
MLSREDNETLVRVGKGTPMGELMRRYWTPAALSSELEPGCDPMRLKLLGEELIAFRTADGQVAVMDHRCPHRRVSLFFGRAEGDGIRCIYHGWKFDATGACVDMPSVSNGEAQRQRVRAGAYASFEHNGLVWVYLGDQGKVPPRPRLEAAMVPGAKIIMLLQECNWMQALEGALDTSHVGFLHCGSIDADDFEDDHPMRPTVYDRAPEYKITETEWGAMYAAYRPDGFGNTSWRVAHFTFPFWTLTPNIRLRTRVLANGWVPVDDHHVMLVLITGGADSGNPLDTPLRNGKAMPGGGLDLEYLPRTNDWLGRWRTKANKSNDYLIDRASQREDRVFAGIGNILTQDQCVTESMGAINDRTQENLNLGDVMVVRTRRALLQAAHALEQKGVAPPGAENPEIALQARGGCYLADPGTDWLQAYEEELRAATRWTGSAPQVETAAESATAK